MKSPNLSVTSSRSSSSLTSGTLSPRFSPRHSLLQVTSPPLSPGLPSLLPRHGKRKDKRAGPGSLFTGLCRRMGLSILVLLIFFWIAAKTLVKNDPLTPGDYELVNSDTLPKHPSVLVVADWSNKEQWTVWIPPSAPFPLQPGQYSEICSQSEQISREMNSRYFVSPRKKGYYSVDPSFVDVQDAVTKGLLPKIARVKESQPVQKDKSDREHVFEGTARDEEENRICDRSLTYVMETSDAGMGNSLLGLWLAYGLAKSEGRHFFVDDTRWPYGSYFTYFQPPPKPPCRQPPPNIRLPCPHSASHLVVSAATFPYAFGHLFNSEFVDLNQVASQQYHRVFNLLRTGYEALFNLTDPGDSSYVRMRTSGDVFQTAHHGGGIVVGLHVRRGDLHPWEVVYEKDYLPLSRYMDRVREILVTRFEHGEEDEAPEHASATNRRGLKNKKSKRHGAAGIMASKLIIASDDPLIYHAPEVSRGVRAQDRIVLASKEDIEAASGGHKTGWLDDIHGWEGGFFRDVFFGLGQPSTNTRAPPSGKSSNSRGTATPLKAVRRRPGWQVSQPITLEALRLRETIARSYLLDLAVVGKSDVVVCAVSSAACRVLGVMLGWDKVQSGDWRNVDGQYGWRGLVVEQGM